jgi:tRNA pseudouridine55 synthase
MPFLIEKKIGETPLEALTAWRSANPEHADTPACYAGRLDPMASGKLLILLGEECKRAKEYTDLDKEYEIEVLLDIGSDTGDVLGVTDNSDRTTNPSPEILTAVLNTQIGTHTLPYPIYSSKTVSGKPLFLYALEGTLDTIQIPTHEETIHDIELLGRSETTVSELQSRIEQLLSLAPTSDEPSKVLGADFRIAEVRRSWKEAFTSNRTYQVIRLRVSCGSGTYMRSLASRIGEVLGTKAVALSIHRTQIYI